MKTKKELRDDFAIAALAGGLEQGLHNVYGAFAHEPVTIARRAYEIAEAMLKRSARL